MYWGALSTDIKKSSVNWNGLPSWMEKAVQYHNTVLETCVLYYKKNKKNGRIKIRSSFKLKSK